MDIMIYHITFAKFTWKLVSIIYF